MKLMLMKFQRKGRSPLDQIFVIRGIPTNPVNSNAVFDFFDDVKITLESSLTKQQSIEIGGIMPDNPAKFLSLAF